MTYRPERIDGAVEWAKLSPDVQSTIGGAAIELVAAWLGRDAAPGNQGEPATAETRAFEAADGCCSDWLIEAISPRAGDPRRPTAIAGEPRRRLSALRLQPLRPLRRGLRLAISTICAAPAMPNGSHRLTGRSLMRYTAWPRVSTYQDTPPKTRHPGALPATPTRQATRLLATLISRSRPRPWSSGNGTPHAAWRPATGHAPRDRRLHDCAPRPGAPGHPGSATRQQFATSGERRLSWPIQTFLERLHALRAGQGRPGRGGRLRAKQARSGSLPHLRCCHSDRAAVPLGPKARPKPGPVRRLSPALPEQSAWRFGPLAQQGQGTPRGLTALGDPAGPPRAQTVPVRPRRTPTPRAVQASGLGPAQGRACLDRARGETAGTGAGGPRARAKGPRP